MQLGPFAIKPLCSKRPEEPQGATAFRRAIVQCFAMKALGLALIVALLSTTAFDLSYRVGKLEKENKELRSLQADKDRVAYFDLQAKCANDARQWFNENWSRDKT